MIKAIHSLYSAECQPALPESFYNSPGVGVWDQSWLEGPQTTHVYQGTEWNTLHGAEEVIDTPCATERYKILSE